jgi:hypothetical protein
VNPAHRALLAIGLSLMVPGASAQTSPASRPAPPAVADAPAQAVSPMPSDAMPDAAQVLMSQGSTTLVRGASYSMPVRREVPLRSGDRVRTGVDGHVQLRFTDGALISIQPGSDFRIEAYAHDAGRQRSFFELMQGSVRAVSGSIGKRDRNDWRLTTPTATIGIRGTEFTVTEAACPASGCPTGVSPGLVLAVVAGRVAVTNAAGTIEVPAGATLRVPDARTVPTLAAAPPKRPAGVGASAARPAAATGERLPILLNAPLQEPANVAR